MGNQFQVTSNTSPNAVVAADGTDWIIVYASLVGITAQDYVSGVAQAPFVFAGTQNDANPTVTDLTAGPDALVTFDNASDQTLFAARTQGIWSAPAPINNALAVQSRAVAALPNGNAVYVFAGPDDNVYFSLYSQGSWSPAARVDPGDPVQKQWTDVTALANGAFVVTWEGVTGDADGSAGVFAEIFSGGTFGSKFEINSTISGQQTQPSVAALTGGGFVEVWTDQTTGGGPTDVMARVFDSSGNAVTGEILVDTHSHTDLEQDPSIVGLPNGGFLVAWDGQSLTGTDQDIYGQQFDASGHGLGPNFVINQVTSGNQTLSVADHGSLALVGNSVVVLWNGDASDPGVFGRQMDIASLPTGVTVSAGQTYTVPSDDIDLGDVVLSGGSETLASGAIVSGAAVSSGGTLDVVDGGTLDGSVVNGGTVNYDITGSATFSGTLTGSGMLVVSGGGHLDVVSAYTGSAEIDDASTLEFSSTFAGAATFSGSSIGSGGTLKFDAGSTGPITVVNANDTVIAQPGNGSWIDAAVSYTLPANIDALFLFAGAHGTGNSDAAGDALYALDTVNTQTLTGHSPNDAFVVYNSSDVVVPEAGSDDVVYAAASYTLPTGIDTLFLEGTAAQGTGNSDAAGDALYAANPGQVATLTGNSANDVFVVYNSSDVVAPKAGSHDSVYSGVNYTLPTGVDTLFLEAGTHGAGNSDASGDALYAADAGIAQTLTGHSGNDVFVVYNSSDVVAPKAGSHDTVYSAVNYTLPTGVDTLFLEAGTQGAGNSDFSDALYAANPNLSQTLIGNSADNTFVVYNSNDVVVARQESAGNVVYAAVNFTLPTNVDDLFLEGNASLGTGNSDPVAQGLFGNSGIASTLIAGSGPENFFYVTGSAGTTMTGGAGENLYTFPNAMGHDEITNFGTAHDLLEFNSSLFANFTAAMTTASQVGANTVFTIDANDTVTLDNVNKSSLTAHNFQFNP